MFPEPTELLLIGYSIELTTVKTTQLQATRSPHPVEETLQIIPRAREPILN